MFNSEANTTFAFLKFWDDKNIFLFGLSSTKTVLLSNKSKFANVLEYKLVDGASKLKSSNTIIFSSLSLYVRADFLANLFTFLLTLKSYFLGLGPKTRPPPLKIGFFISPTLAAPLPFCFLIFLRLQMKKLS